MSQKLRPFVLGCVLAVAAGGCNGDDGPGGQFADAAPRPDAGPPGDAAAADAAPLVDAPMNVQGPVVSIIEPEEPAADDFSSDAILTDKRFTVRCRAETNPDTGDSVDATSVRVSASGEGGSVETSALPTATTDVYAGELNVGSFANGPLQVRCSAADTSAEARTNSDEIGTYLDLGPRIEIFSPMSEGDYAGQIELSFQVSEAPVAAGDDGAAPDLAGVEIMVAGTVIDDIEPDANGVFQGVIRFDDPMFDNELEGPNTIVIEAANVRSPDPVVRTQSLVFNADSKGPTIAINDPKPGDLVSGIVTFSVNVSDDVGVDADSVIATVAGEHEVELAGVGGSTFEGNFDSRILENMVFPTVVVRAKDAVGNQSSIGYIVALDNKAPLVHLDPPRLREAQWNANAEGLECSLLFDPVGSDAVSDGDSVPQLSEIRARVEDRGNIASTTEGVIIPHGGVDSDTVQLWILDDETRPLVVDTNGDGVCDAINPHIVPTSVPMAGNEAAVIDLSPISPQGNAPFLPPPGTAEQPDYSTEPPEDQCIEPTGEQFPSAVCVQTPMTRVIKAEYDPDPVIYTIPPVTQLQCVGNAFDSVATNISDGWACLAVRAADNLGNVAISPPTRVCFDHDGDEAEGCKPWGAPWDEQEDGALADCTGTYDAGTDTVESTPCSWPTSFADNPYRQLRRNDL